MGEGIGCTWGTDTYSRESATRRKYISVLRCLFLSSLHCDNVVRDPARSGAVRATWYR